MENMNKRGIYTDFVKELAAQGYNVYTVSPRERRTDLKTELVHNGNIHNLRVKTGNITKCNFIEKGISTLLIEWQYLFAIKKYLGNIKFDLVTYSTPPITLEKVVKYFKHKENSFTYLILKDIFPQNAVDINLMKKNSLLYKYFRYKEKKLYKISDYIGCMSKANEEYILKHNPFIDRTQVEIFPNAIKPISRQKVENSNKDILEEYNIPKDKTLFIYGGNLGKPQGVDFLLKVAKNFDRVENGFLLIVGSGTEYNRIERFLEKNILNSVALFSYLPKEKYDKLLLAADVGLIFLDHRFTIPNFPSRLTAYMEQAKPILAATDVNTDIGDVIEDSNSGYWTESSDLEAFIAKANTLSTNNKLRREMGVNARNYLEENYDIKDTINILTKHLKT
jgi:glycosyltransferase involved in cell wall biosynthesis